MEQEEYEKQQQKRLSKMLVKETGKKYMTVLREVQTWEFDRVVKLIKAMNDAKSAR